MQGIIQLLALLVGVAIFAGLSLVVIAVGMKIQSLICRLFGWDDMAEFFDDPKRYPDD